ncbi:FAD-dependent monooxygenase, partial [Streptomyces sp. MCAF7]
AERYRAGRVFLLGDAAHVHSAIGGPGLNMGLQDAVNLGWKLAAELRGHAPEGLLDSYEAERAPVALRVAMHTQAQSLLIRPGGEVTALRELFGELLAQPTTRQHLADLMSGADITYDMGPATGPLVGRWAPDLPGLREA